MHYKLMRLLEENPGLSQRDAARELGVSLGKINYCLRALIARGWVKATNFKNSQNKAAYLYMVTPSGIAGSEACDIGNDEKTNLCRICRYSANND